jgi:ribosomal protein S27AE
MKVERIEYEMTDEEYQDFLTGVFGEIDVCGFKYDAGYVLKELDPTAFRCGKVDEESEHGDTFKCGECGEIYDDEDDAEACCKPDEDTE